MAAKTVNIEVGKRLCKVCLSEKKGKGFTVSDTFLFATPEGTVVDGTVIDPIVLGEKVKAELRARDVNVANCIFSLNSSKVASRDVDLPVAKDDQIKNVVNTNVSEYFPIDVSKYAVSHTVLERSKTDARAMVVAVPTQIIEGYTNLAEVAGLTCEWVDFAGNSQYQVLKSITTEGVSMYVTVDPDTTMVTFMEGGKYLMQRSIQMGGDDMICRYMASKLIADENYLDALNALSVGSETFDEEVDTEDLSDFLMRVVGGINRSVDFFRSGKFADKEISKVVLMGSCGHLVGLKERVSEALQCETLWLEEVPDIAGLANSINGIAIYINCLGAKMAPMRLLPKEYLDRTGQGKQQSTGVQNYGIIVLAGALVISLALCGTVFFKYYSNKKELAETESSISELQYAEGKYNAYCQYTAGDAALQTFVDRANGNNANLLAFFQELEAKMPSSIIMLSANCNETSVSINVTVPDFGTGAMTLRQLRSFESIDVINCSAMAQSESESGASEVSFSLSAVYRIEETTTQPVVTEAPTEETID